jgi:polysaccharide biosynthesis/export protein
LPDSTREAVKTVKYNNLKIQKNDILEVKIIPISGSSLGGGDGANNSSTLSTASNSTNSSSNNNSSYLVDENGDISLPLIGDVHIEGLSILDAKNLIKNKADYYFKSPVVSVRFLNFKVSVLGEVMKPGVYNFSTEKNTIFDALAVAGDLSIYGKRTNLVLIRDSLGYTTYTRFSLTSKDLPTKDFYYLKQNDIVYVEPNKAKIQTLNSGNITKIGIVVSILTMLSIVYSQVLKN